MNPFHIGVGLFAIFILINLLRMHRKFKEMGSAGEGKALKKISRGEFDQYMAGVKEAIEGEDLDRAIKIIDNILMRISMVSQQDFYGKAMETRGKCYQRLAEKDRSIEDFNRAEAAYRLAIRAFGQANTPSQAATVQTNLGNLYSGLSQITEPEANFEKAIEAFVESLEFFTVENHPEKHAINQVSIGRARSELAERIDKRENLIHAMRAYGEALKIYKPDKHPMEYAVILSNLGNTFFSFSEVQEREKFLARSAQAYNQSLNIITEEKHPELYVKIQSYLDQVNDRLGS